MTREISPVQLVQEVNDNRGCPFTIPRADQIGSAQLDEMTPDARKAEYYYLLDGALEEVMEEVEAYREVYPGGVIKRDEHNIIVSGLADLEARVYPSVAKGDFLTATYWTHNGIYRTIDTATEEWLARQNKSSPAYVRLNGLVDDGRQAAFGEVAIQKRISAAANQAVFISCSMQRFTDGLFKDTYGRRITPGEMQTAHAANLKLAMPLTQFHLLETVWIRDLLGTHTLPRGQVEIYTKDEYFKASSEGPGLQFNGNKLAVDLQQFEGTFEDGRIGCPGLKYVPGIWQWAGELSARYAIQALDYPER